MASSFALILAVVASLSGCCFLPITTGFSIAGSNVVAKRQNGGLAAAPASRQGLTMTHQMAKNDDDKQRGNSDSNRRDFISTLLTATATAGLLTATTTVASSPALAAEEEELMEVYFGCGCFWHVQHEFVEAERNLLGRRDDAQITARAGYAGGKAGAAADGRVCYHNALGVADYGSLGHAEVVSLKIPPSKYEAFAVEYCKLFNNGLRPDQNGDRGPEYRNLVGIKGGSKSELAQQLVKASLATGDQLDFAVGKGNDADLRKVVFIMDTDQFPFFVAEQYHQFHDGFNFGENYPNSYNGLAAKFGKAGENFGTCPNGLVGIGIGGL